MRYINKKRRVSIWGASVLGVFLVAANLAEAQTPSPALLVLEKSDNMLAIVDPANLQIVARVPAGQDPHEIVASPDGDRKSTRLNSSHRCISYAVFCLKKKKN